MKKSVIATILVFTSLTNLQAGGCSYGPLKPCSWGATVRGGVEWMWYPDKVRNDYENAVAITDIQIDTEAETEIANNDLVLQIDTQRTPRFDDQFDLPWVINAELSYALSCNTEVFMDFHYGEACGRTNTYGLAYEEILDETNTITIKPAESFRVKEKYSDLDYLGVTLGMRHYLTDIAGCAYPFFGVKAGFRHWDPVWARISATRTTTVGEETPVVTEFDAQKVGYYDSYNVVHGGAQVGLDIRITECFQLVLTGEILASCGLKAHRDGTKFASEATVAEDLDPGDNVVTYQAYSSSLNVPSRRTLNVLSFPVTIGMRLSF